MPLQILSNFISRATTFKPDGSVDDVHLTKKFMENAQCNKAIFSHFRRGHCVVSENIHTSPMGCFFGLSHETLPLWKFQFNFILSFKNLGLSEPPPPPSEFPVTNHGVGTDIYWNHTFQCLAESMEGNDRGKTFF